MNKVKQLVRERKERRERREATIEYAIAHASTDSERNELIDLASAQGVYV